MLANDIGVKIFTATKARERDELGEQITRWLRSSGRREIVSRTINQSSDREYHCLTITIVYKK